MVTESGTDGLSRPAHRLCPGQVVHGFAGGYLGRDSYACRRVVLVGRTNRTRFVVLWNGTGHELLEDRAIGSVAVIADDRSYCSDGCEGPET